jgi:hypothetical protein
MPIRWVPLVGQFEFGRDATTFTGGSTPPAAQDQAAVTFAGIALNELTMVNGRLSAVVTFQNHVTGSSVFELMFGHDPGTRAHVTAGIGGSGAMYSIREWVTKPALETLAEGLPPRGSWKNLALDGDRRNLRADTPYEVAVNVEGSLVQLDVNGVRVLETTLPSAPNKPKQLGLFCLSETNLTVANYSATVEQPRVFIVMQFSSPYNEVYSHVIKAVCKEMKLTAIRADELYGPEIIIKDVIDNITKSQVVIADVSPTNPNVYFEVGYALALGKPIVLMAQRRKPDEPLPFDVSAFRVLFYDDSIGGKPLLEEGLRRHLREILGRS